MKFPRIINEIACNTWAMRQESFSAMMSIITKGGDDDMYSLFHSMEEAERGAFIGDLGNRPDGLDLVRIDGNVGIIDIDGPIVHRASGVAKVSGLTSIEGLGREYQALEDNPEIDTAILLLDTPGGVVAGTSEFVAQVKKSRMKTIAYVYGVAASVGYWIASAADVIISSDVGVTGSIGVVMTARVMDNDNIVEIISKQSPNKRASLKSKEGKANAQEVVDDMAEIFINAVANGRGTTAENVLKNYGQGKIFVAAEAKKRGMIDAIGTISDVVAAYKKKETGAAGALAADSADSSDTVDTPDTLAAGDPTQGDGEYSLVLFGKKHPFRMTGDKSAPIEFIRSVESQPEGHNVTPENTERESETEGNEMTLKDFLKENPDARGEVDAIVNEAVKGYREIAVSAATTLKSDAYKGPIAELALKVIAGSADISALDAAIAAVDQGREDEKSRAAQGESEKLGDIGGEPAGAAPSTDGTIRNDADIAQAAEDIASKAIFA